MHIIFATIGDDGSRQSASDAASFVRFVELSLLRTIPTTNMCLTLIPYMS
jgi:hypothetical protein